jgi:hypothetical protein
MPQLRQSAQRCSRSFVQARHSRQLPGPRDIQDGTSRGRQRASRPARSRASSSVGRICGRSTSASGRTRSSSGGREASASRAQSPVWNIQVSPTPRSAAIS